jgi:NAD(P)-dependent dehydrogenase (short-subunit alcohol dehydrogenase family)
MKDCARRRKRRDALKRKEGKPMAETRQVALITGGGSGIGRETALLLAARGWRVGVIDRDQPAAKAVAAEVGGEAETADVSDEAAITTAVNALADRLGAPTGLVNSAAIASLLPAMETNAAQFRRILDVNVVGSLLAARAAARLMQSAGGGAIVNIASVSGLRGNIDRLAYGASKAAVVQMTQILAVEWAEARIRVNAIAPGPVETPLAAVIHGAATREAWVAATPMHRYATPREIATAIAFLLDSDQAGYVTGICLPVDGGFLAGGLIRPR